MDPGTDVVAVIVKGATAEKVAVDDAGFVYESSADDFEIEFAFRDRGHFAALKTAGVGGDFDAVADGTYREVGVEKVPG